MIKIVQKEAKVLRDMAVNVPTETIKSQKIQNVLKEMRIALDSQEDGVAIAAPQIGYPFRIFIVSHKVADLIKKKPKRLVAKPDEQLDKPETEPKPILDKSVFINPIIRKLSKEKKIMEEGCLSVRYLYGKVKRSDKATIEAYDENGIKFTKGGSGILAQIFQHEVDHLNGVLFTDKAVDVQDLPPPEVKRLNRKNRNEK